MGLLFDGPEPTPEQRDAAMRYICARFGFTLEEVDEYIALKKREYQQRHIQQWEDEL